MGLVTILAVLAFGISLVALWLTSDIIKKVETQNEKFVRAHMGALREELRDMEKAIEKTARLVAAHHEQQAGMSKRLDEHAQNFDEMRERLTIVTNRLDELDRSIPPRYRIRVVKPDAKDSRKASIQ